MEEMQDFKRQYEELAARIDNIEEVGVLELRRVFEELTSLDNRSAISIENYTNDSDNDLYDRLEALKIWDELKEKIRVKEVESLNQYRSRKEVLDAKFSEYRRIKMYRRDNQRRINEYKFELDKHKALLNHISDSFAKDNMEDTIKDDEKHIAKAEELNKKYDKELFELDKECRILLNGGKLSDLGKVDEEDIVDELDRDNVKTTSEPLEKPEPEKQKEEEPSLITPKKVSVKREEDDAPVLPPKFTEPAHDKHVLPPKFVDLEEEEEAPVLPPKFVDEPENDEILDAPVLPPKFVEDEPEEEYTDEDEEFTPVEAKVVTPKPSIWKKIGGVLVKAVAFLAVVGTAVHTGILAGKTPQKVAPEPGREETTEETEAEEKKEDKKETKKEEKKEEPVKEESKEESKEEAKQETKKETPVEETKQEDKKEEKKEEKKEDKKEEPAKEETLDIKLNPGETVYDTNTGVEVGYNGNAAALNSDGSVEKQSDRKLEYNDDNQAIVTDKDLNRDKKEEAPAKTSNTRSGLEVPEEEFDKNLTEEEKAVADSQEEEWFRMLEESGLGR